MHETIPRSKTRGRPPEERFNGRICIMLHPDVHHMCTRHVLDIEPVDVDAGCDGVVNFKLCKPDDPLWRAFNAGPLARVLRWRSAPSCPKS